MGGRSDGTVLGEDLSQERVPLEDRCAVGGAKAVQLSGDVASMLKEEPVVAASVGAANFGHEGTPIALALVIVGTLQRAGLSPVKAVGGSKATEPHGWRRREGALSWRGAQLLGEAGADGRVQGPGCCGRRRGGRRRGCVGRHSRGGGSRRADTSKAVSHADRHASGAGQAHVGCVHARQDPGEEATSAARATGMICGGHACTGGGKHLIDGFVEGHDRVRELS